MIADVESNAQQHHNSTKMGFPTLSIMSSDAQGTGKDNEPGKYA